MTTTLPTRLEPVERTRSRSRRAAASPPATVRLSWARARSVSGPQVPSGRRPDAALQLAQAALGVGPEPAVGATGEHPEPQQLALQLEHVVAELQVAGHVPQDPVADPPPGGVERPGGVGADDAVGVQPAVLLEGAHRELEVVVERLGRSPGPACPSSTS